MAQEGQFATSTSFLSFLPPVTTLIYIPPILGVQYWGETYQTVGAVLRPFGGAFIAKERHSAKNASLFIFQPRLRRAFLRLCRYRPYPKAGRTVRLRLFALGKPFLTGMPDRIPRGIWKANARLHVLTAFDRLWGGIICRLPNRGTV